jgi:hypothetical protein
VPVGGEFQVNTNTFDVQSYPAVAIAPNQDFVVVWHGFDGDSHGIHGQRFASTGSPLGGEFQVNTLAGGLQWLPALAMNDGGAFVVTWTGLDGDGPGVRGQRFDADGLAVGGEFAVNSFTTNIQRRPSVATDMHGRFVVVWDSVAQDYDSYGVFGQVLDSTGAPVGAEFRVNWVQASRQKDPSVSMDTSGRFVVAWESYWQDGDTSGVFAQRFLAPIFADGFESGNTSVWSASLP